MAIKIKRNTFDLSFTNTLTADMGKLIPVFTRDVLPGDHFKINLGMFTRSLPFLSPMFGNIKISTRFFFVPNRLLWSNWERFITGGLTRKEQEGVQPVPPFVTGTLSNDSNGLVTGTAAPGTLLDYLGANNHVHDSNVKLNPASQSFNVDALYPRAYQSIYNYFYHHEDDENDPYFKDVELSDGKDSKTNLNLYPNNWSRDYFTRCLPYQQKGNPAVIPVSPISTSGTTLTMRGKPITMIQKFNSTNTSSLVTCNVDSNGVPQGDLQAYNSSSPTSSRPYMQFGNSMNGTSKQVEILVNGNVTGTLGELSITDLRNGIALQRIFENSSRSGTRFSEYLQSTFGTNPGDYILQNPVYLGGSVSNIVVSPIMQTSASTSSSPQGNQTGTGAGLHGFKPISFFAREHGIIMCLMSIQPIATYQQGTPKMLAQKTSRFDYYTPFLAHISEQPVYSSELFCTGDPAKDSVIFGYLPAWEHHRRAINQIHGDMRTTMNYWHCSRIFKSAPVWGDKFLKADPTKRMFAVTNTTTPFMCQLGFHVKVSRLLPKRGTPALL